LAEAGLLDGRCSAPGTGASAAAGATVEPLVATGFTAPEDDEDVSEFPAAEPCALVLLHAPISARLHAKVMNRFISVSSAALECNGRTAKNHE
jgi:hypothetical protein